MRRAGIAVVASTALLAFPLSGQVRQATPEETAPAGATSSLKEVPSPMLIDISLGAGQAPTGKPRKSLRDTPGITRAYTDAAGYVCDKARVGVILVREEEHRGKVALSVSTSLSTEWLRQHVNLTVALRSQDREILHQRWEDIVIGAQKGAAVNALGTMALGIGTSSAKAPTAEWELTSDEWAALWAAPEPPSLRVIVEIRE